MAFLTCIEIVVFVHILFLFSFSEMPVCVIVSAQVVRRVSAWAKFDSEIAYQAASPFLMADVKVL